MLHNPRCSKSRATLALLEEGGHEPEVILYLESAPDASQIQSILKKLGLTARQLMRKGEPEYREHQIDNPALSEDQLVEAMVQFPKLIERPIVLANGKAAIGRPPESVLDIL
jgi:arsenate reductase